MNYFNIEELKDLIIMHTWHDTEGLLVWIHYSDCEEVFKKQLQIEHMDYTVNCVAKGSLLIVPHFEEILEYYIDEEEIKEYFPTI